MGFKKVSLLPVIPSFQYSITPTITTGPACFAVTDKPDLKNMTLEEIEAFVASLGKEKYRARQSMKWI